MNTLKVVALCSLILIGNDHLIAMEPESIETIQDLPLPDACQTTIDNLCQLLKKHQSKPKKIVRFISKMCTAYKQHDLSVQLLLDSLQAAHLSLSDIVDSQGSTILHHACDQHVSLDCLKVLLFACDYLENLLSRINHHGETIFHLAAFWGLDDHIRTFVQSGLNPHTIKRLLKHTDWQDEDPIDVALRRNHPFTTKTIFGVIWHEKFKRLLHQDPDETQIKDFIDALKQELSEIEFGLNDTMQSSSSSSYSDDEMAQIMQKFNPGIKLHEIRNEKNQTLLHVACLQGDPNLVAMIFDTAKSNYIRYDSNYDQVWQSIMAKDENGHTACELAVLQDQKHILKILLKKMYSYFKNYDYKRLKQFMNASMFKGISLHQYAKKHKLIGCVQSTLSPMSAVD